MFAATNVDTATISTKATFLMTSDKGNDRGTCKTLKIYDSLSRTESKIAWLAMLVIKVRRQR